MFMHTKQIANRCILSKFTTLFLFIINDVAVSRFKIIKFIYVQYSIV